MYILKYYIGLDMGTSSLGWAVTDQNYKLMRKKGKDLWGVRLFPEAKTSAERRSQRVAKRRLERKKARIGYLKSVFADEILKVDPGFYQRLEESKYWLTDKTEQQKYALFSEKDFTDQDYYKKYPTIFHLRKELLDSKNPHDVRLVFLAVLSLFKHRGHFLNKNLTRNGFGEVSELYESMTEMYQEIFQQSFTVKDASAKLDEILSDKKLTSQEKLQKLLKLFEISKAKEKGKTEICKWMCGLSAKLSVIFSDNTWTDDEKKFSLSFRDGNFEEKLLQVEEMVSAEEFELILAVKEIYDWSVLAKIMTDEDNVYQYLSEARVKLYEKHKADLTLLKMAVKKYAPKSYAGLFRIMKDNNYSAYVGHVNYKKKIRRGAKCNTEDFMKSVEKIVKSFPDGEEKVYILAQIQRGTFLPKQMTSDNGVIPNQIHLMELKEILKNVETYLPFLAEVDESGLTVSERLIEMFCFQIPYYVGSFSGSIGTGNSNSKNVWSVRIAPGKIYPWNMDEKIDIKASAENFISRMVNHCTYLNNETVLPKSSLLYEKFAVLNELNNLRINGEKISVDLKQQIYNDLFISGKKVTGKRLKNYLLSHIQIDSEKDFVITGIDIDFTNKLSSYAFFCNILNTKYLTDSQREMAENIIFWGTVYGDTKSFLRQKITDNYGDCLSPEQIKRIMGCKYKEWGNLSKELLLLEGADTDTGEMMTIIQRLWNTNDNFMELLSGRRYTYSSAIQERIKKTEKTLSDVEYEDLEDTYMSAPVRRMTWQTILVLKEICQVMGESPEKIFIEMAREKDAKKERTTSRKNRLLALYKNCKESEIEWEKEISAKEEYAFKSKKLYLYYMQMGRCMYTGARIRLSDLMNDNLYDIDHIYPRHYVKDDSLENNLVLVKKENNADKKDVFPLSIKIQEEQKGFWRELKEKGFISEEKYKRLMRRDPFTEDEFAGFISRQLVETRQGTKVIADLLQQTFEGKCKIVYVKAGNVSDFRKKFGLLKCRAINDYHHANDAYLNIVVGNVYHTKFTDNPRNFIREYRKNPKKNPYHMEKLFEYRVERNGICAWEVKDSESIRMVKSQMKKNSILVTMMNFEQHGGISNQNIIGRVKIENVDGVGYIPVKSSDVRLQNVCRYGGLSNVTGAYFFLVEYTQKNKRIRSIESMPLYLKDTLNTEDEIADYCMNVLGYSKPVICVKKIKMYSLLKVNGFYLYLTGRSGNQLLVCNAVQLVIGKTDMEYIRILTNVVAQSLTTEQMELKGITVEKNVQLYNILLEKHLHGIYQRRPNPVGEKLNAGFGQFEQLGLCDQVIVLNEILCLSQRANDGVDLHLIGNAKATGKMRINKKITGLAECRLVNLSPSGIYKNEIDLLSV